MISLELLLEEKILISILLALGGVGGPHQGLRKSDSYLSPCLTN
jgi:hypothetical protein